MSNLELEPQETLCGTGHSELGTARVEVIGPRDVPLGGPRAMPVRRTLPSKERSLIGAWCFLDHYGPDDVSTSGGMRVPPHPHTGLQTVSWLFTGEIDHRDSAGHHALVRPGELNLMTAGRGINHSEYSTPGTTVLHGAQLWVALPDGARHTDPGFERYVPPAVVLDGDGATATAGEARVFLGTLAGSVSPVRTHTPLVGAEILLLPGAEAAVAVDPEFEHGVLADNLPARVEGAEVPIRTLAYIAPGRGALRLSNPGRATLRLLLLGGAPFDEEITMWWNFVGRSHEEIVAFRELWQREIGAEPGGAEPGGVEPANAEPVGAEQAGAESADAESVGAERAGAEPARPAEDATFFGPVVELTGGESALPAPELPHVRLRPRGGSRERKAR